MKQCRCPTDRDEAAAGPVSCLEGLYTAFRAYEAMFKAVGSGVCGVWLLARAPAYLFFILLLN